jgi:Tfp pilus assembly protein PilO
MPALLVIYAFSAFGFFMYGAGKLLEGLAAMAETEVFKSWYFGQQTQVAQVQPLPPLSQDIEALYTQFQQHMDTLYQLDALLRSVS